MIRFTFALAALLGFSRALAAETRGILVLDEWGVYSATIDRRIADPNSTTGHTTLSRDVRLVERTHLVCAQLGSHFGIRYHIRDDVPANSIALSVDVAHPPMLNLRGAMQSHDEVTRPLAVHTSAYSGWTFSEPRELLAGDWHIIVSHGAAVDIDEIFHVHTACTATVS